uniref:Uncharacterized protein n=1 Tax=Rhizophora mucronata TaxID=61149 RepID=A0A2P2Q6M8_RHIMU
MTVSCMSLVFILAINNENYKCSTKSHINTMLVHVCLESV